MADSILAIVPCIYSCINSTGLPGCLRGEASTFFSLEENWKVLQEKIKELRILRDQVEKNVKKETDQGNKCDPCVEMWQNKVKDHKEYTKEDYNQLYRCQDLCNCTPNLGRRCSHGKRIAKKIQYVTNLIEEGNKFNVFGCKQPDSVVGKPQARTFGMEPQKIQLFKYFEDPEKRIIGIWGQGGAGKTTLLNRFNNELKKENGDLHVVIMIEVSNFTTLKVVDIQRVITDRLGLQWSGTEEEDTRAKILVKALKSRNFVIMLDDVWDAFKVENVGIPVPDEQSNSKLIVTSRDKNVCIHMGAQRSLIQMEHLSWMAAWELFQENLTLDAINAINSSDHIKKLAMGIARNCGGLPLALNLIGKAVAGLKEPEEWRYALKETRTDLVEFAGGKGLFNGLVYSYNKLKPEQKQCLLYCTLFPGNGSIKKHQLVHYWMAEGLINDPDQGYYIIGHLVSACLLQCNDSYSEVKMHHIVREFGLVEATKRGKFLVQAGMGLVEAPGSEVWNEAATRISLMSNNLKDLPIPPRCESLLTLLLQNNTNLARLDSNFFRRMQCLRVLDLSYTDITELEGCDGLVELQHLNLCHTRIKKLHDFSNLKKLRHLDLSITWCLEDTYDNCSKLLNLVVLNLFRSSCGIRDVDDLNIDILEKLEFLGIAIHAYDVLKKLNEKHRLAKATRLLSLKYCEGMKFVKISDFKEMVNLEELYIESCNDLKQLTADNVEQRNSCLRVLTLAVLSNLDTILVGPEPGNFQNLCDITISECHKLDNVTWVKRLKSLERLIILQCDGMVQVVNETQNNTPSTSTLQPNRDNEIQVIDQEAFPKLRSIILTGLNRLESICSTRYFCCLRSITVEACPKLRRLPVGENNTIAKLEQICGSREWWEKLIWEGTKIKEELDKRFLPI
ncbi:disease resistance protein RPS2-like [Typha latifolia]|uniref:disease resistance protein RPS2-like n=1 Tax=Typha latifolia TaxID=4733 RepID=UPI003C2CD066